MGNLMGSFISRYGLYLVRWQLSTPILAISLVYLASLGRVWSAVVANLIGGLLFFWVDRFIFTNPGLGRVWAVEEQVVCADCGKVDRGYRLVCAASGKYDKRRDPKPEFRCEACSRKKFQELQEQGKVG